MRYTRGAVAPSPTDNIDLIRRVLGENYLELKITRLAIEEDFDSGLSHVVVDTVDSRGQTQSIEGDGCGIVDALWAGFSARYSPEYESLKSIELVAFDVNAKFETPKAGLPANSGSDAVCEVTLKIRNSESKTFAFSDTSRSLVSSSSRAAVAGISYFINAERAFLTLYHSLEDARERNRADLVTRYTKELAEVVKSTSYAEVIESLKKKL